MQTIVLLVAAVSCALGSRCGERLQVVQTDRIVGGHQALPNEFPWQVSLQLLNSHLCGASILNEEWIITAAHCADYFPFLYRVLVGKHNLNIHERTEQLRFVTKVIRHPGYNEDTVDFDIALMKLSRPLDFNFNVHIGPVCLPKPNEDFTDQICTASGWGLTLPDGADATTLRKVNLRVWNNTECAEAYEQVNYITSRMMCVGYKEGGKGPCQGDSGGPLVCRRKDGSWVLAGTTSWGTVCGAPDQPGVFARVSSFVEWIEARVK